MTTYSAICLAILPTLLGAALAIQGPNQAGAKTPWGKEVNGLSSRLVLLEGSKVGEPVKVRLELWNAGREERTYDSQQAAVNNSLDVKGPDNKPVPYTDLSYQTASRERVLKPGQTVTILDSLDVAAQYLLDKPGAYVVQFHGRGEIPASNVLNITLDRGTVPPITEVYNRLRAVAPREWRLAKSANAILASRVPTSLKRDTVTVQLWFTKEKKSGYENLPTAPANLEYVGETRLGHAWMSADDGVKAHWPTYGQELRGVAREFQAKKANEKE